MDLALVSRYMREFFGYGHTGAKYWFVGLEEGGVKDLSQFEERVKAWADLKCASLVDIRDFYAQIAGQNWFSNNPPLQRTWRPLIRTRFVAEGLAPDVEGMKRYQMRELASRNGDTALLELLPLPARGRNDPWLYRQLVLPGLKTRDEYVDTFRSVRGHAIRKLIDDHGPVAVVTYGEIDFWKRQLHATERLNTKAWSGVRNSTLVVCTHHPEGARANVHWDEIGAFIRANRRQPR